MEAEHVFAQAVASTLTVTTDCGGRSATVAVRSVARPGPFVVTVTPAASGGWHVVDPCDPEPTWRGSLTEAIEEAVALAAAVLAERVAGEVSRLASPTVTHAAADIC